LQNKFFFGRKGEAFGQQGPKLTHRTLSQGGMLRANHQSK
jgi:hypothetical protein